MPTSFDEDLKPPIGFALWHLQRGETPANVLSRLANDNRYRYLSAEKLQQALDQAVRNNSATARMRIGRYSRNLATAFIGGVLQTDVIGVRIGVPEGQGNPNAWHGSITVNAPASMSIEEVEAEVKRRIAAGGMEARGRDTLAGNMDDAFAYQLIEGGLDSPAIDLTRT
jgi:hypothetical protein